MRLVTALRLAALIAALGGLGVAGRMIWTAGYTAAERDQAAAVAELQDQVDSAVSLVRALTVELLADRRELSELERRLAREAQDDPDADRPALGLGSVQRLNQLR